MFSVLLKQLKNFVIKKHQLEIHAWMVKWAEEQGRFYVHPVGTNDMASHLSYLGHLLGSETRLDLF